MSENRRLRNSNMKITLRDIIIVAGTAIVTVAPTVFDYSTRLSVAETKIEALDARVQRLYERILHIEETKDKTIDTSTTLPTVEIKPPVK